MTPPFLFVGELSALGAAFIWAGSLVGFRFYGNGFPAQEANLFKNLISLLCLSAVLAAAGGLPAVDARALWLLLLSGAVGIAMGDTAFFAALSRLNAQLTAVSQCLSPVTAAVLAWVFLGERLTAFEIAGMSLTLVAVAGAILLGGHMRVIPRRSLAAGLGFAALSAVANGTGIVIARDAFSQVDAVTGTFIRVVAAVVLLLPLVLFRGRPGFRYCSLFTPRSRGVGLTLSAFAGSFLGLLLMSAGIKYAKAGVAAALSLTYPIWIIPVARIFLEERASWLGVLCVILAVAGVALMFVRWYSFPS